MDLELGCVGVEAGGGFASAFLSGEGVSPGVSPSPPHTGHLTPHCMVWEGSLEARGAVQCFPSVTSAPPSVTS